DCFLRENLGRILIDEVVAAFDGVEGVPLPVVFFDVREGRRHAALRRSRVGAGRVELGDDGGAGLGPRFDGGAHSGAARSDDDDVVLVVVNTVDDGSVFDG